MYEVRGGVSRTRLFVGVALCVALFAFVGCPDAGNPGGGPDGGTPDTAPPVITLTGSEFIVLEIGDTFTDPGFDVNDDDPNYTGTVTPTVTGTGSTINTAAAGVYTITYTAPADAADNTPETVTRTVTVINPIDRDTNNRIDINFLEDLNAMRHNLAGTSYRASADGTEMQCGSAGTTACEGYELTRDLDFADGDSYTDGTVNTAWRPDAADPDSATNEGWNPIGTFSGSFFGNGFVISNLYVRRSGNVGLFGVNSGTIERIGVVDGSLYGGVGDSDDVGGLIGSNSGTITASYATGNADGGAGRFDDVGGLVGNNSGGTITASYATGNADGGAGESDDVGGLVGDGIGTIMASYATGNADGGAGDNDRVGGLLGYQIGGTITASYATGNADGGAGSDGASSLIGFNTDSAPVTIASYGFGSGSGGFGVTRSGDTSPSGTVPNACALTQANSSTMTSMPDNRWDAAQWDFGTAMQRPIVLHDGNPVRGQEDRRC